MDLIPQWFLLKKLQQNEKRCFSWHQSDSSRHFCPPSTLKRNDFASWLQALPVWFLCSLEPQAFCYGKNNCLIGASINILNSAKTAITLQCWSVWGHSSNLTELPNVQWKSFHFASECHIWIVNDPVIWKNPHKFRWLICKIKIFFLPEYTNLDLLPWLLECTFSVLQISFLLHPCRCIGIG